jgi:hypothetical protein
VNQRVDLSAPREGERCDIFAESPFVERLLSNGRTRMSRRKQARRRRDCVKGRGEWIGSERTSEPERADEMLMPGMAGQNFGIKALARLRQRRIMAVLFYDPRSRGAHDDTPRCVNVNAEAG